MSHLQLHFDGDQVIVELRIQELTLREVPRWSLDSDGSGEISNFEVEANWDRVATLIEEGLWLEFDGEVVHPAFSIIGYPGETHPHEDGSFDFTHVLVQATLPRPASLSDAKIHSDLFLADGNPKHSLHITLIGLEGADRLYLLRGEETEYSFHIPSSFEVLNQYTELGWGHVLEGYDHLAFLLALLFGVASLRSLVGAVTAFTLAHSITLALAALDLVRLPASIVEPCIALSVLAVLILHLRRPPSDARPWLPAFLFGLLHGFGFAGVLGEIGIPPDNQVMSLLGFNLGVEAGQLTFVLPVVLIAFVIKQRTSISRWLQVREWVALPALAFAMLLVGNAANSYLFDNPNELGQRGLLLFAGIGCAILLSLLPLGLPEAVKRQRMLVGQAGLLLVFFQLGQMLRG
jgi:hydrogenase/urease accessory protein HupE